MNNNFAKDLEDGHKGEMAVRHFVESVMGLQFKKFNDNAYFDILFQNPYEDPVTFEVKSDYFEKDWDKGGSGNMAIEYKCRGKPSGIRKTKATYFAYYFPNLSSKQLWIIRVEDLKKLIKDNNFSRVSGGETYYDSDDKVAKMFLFNRFDQKEHFDVYTWDGRGWIDE